MPDNWKREGPGDDGGSAAAVIEAVGLSRDSIKAAGTANSGPCGPERQTDGKYACVPLAG